LREDCTDQFPLIFKEYFRVMTEKLGPHYTKRIFQECGQQCAQQKVGRISVSAANKVTASFEGPKWMPCFATVVSAFELSLGETAIELADEVLSKVLDCPKDAATFNLFYKVFKLKNYIEAHLCFTTSMERRYLLFVDPSDEVALELAIMEYFREKETKVIFPCILRPSSYYKETADTLGVKYDNVDFYDNITPDRLTDMKLLLKKALSQTEKDAFLFHGLPVLWIYNDRDAISRYVSDFMMSTQKSTEYQIYLISKDTQVDPRIMMFFEKVLNVSSSWIDHTKISSSS